MKKLAFNEAELFLIKKWAEARDLEKSMAKVREKHRELLQQIGEEVLRGCRNDLDVFGEYFEQSWAVEGHVMFGRRAWPSENGYVPDGLWFQNLSLDYLTSGAEAPRRTCWLDQPERPEWML
jgi:hypothetical protein